MWMILWYNIGQLFFNPNFDLMNRSGIEKKRFHVRGELVSWRSENLFQFRANVFYILTNVGKIKKTHM